jgi:hypothetical protein
MEDLAIVALVGVIGLFLVFFFLLTVGVAVGFVAVVISCKKRRTQRRWSIGDPWIPLTVFVPLHVINACQTEKPEAQTVLDN